MPEGRTVEIKGIKTLARTLRKAGEEEARDMLLAANKEAAAIVESTARPMVPRRTGKLAASLKSSGNAKGGVVQIGKKTVPYAGPIHFGWPRRGIAPRPFMYEAMDKRADEVEAIYLKRLEAVLATVKGI